MKSANTRFRGKTGLALFLLLALLLPTLISCRGNNAESSKSGIAILFTADIHSYIDGPLSYDVIAALKQSLAEEYARVLLVDAGDHLQGTAYGSMDEGRTVTELMNAAGYDAATLGNHEFDYGMFGCMRTIDNADFSYVSCNFYHETNGVRGENVLDPYVLFECGDEVVAFVGITTPETFSKSTPAYFQDENGDFIYGIAGGRDGSELYLNVQNAVDDARASGATVIIALGHLGTDLSSVPWTSEEVIAATEGLDAFIDGHSHTVTEKKQVADKNNASVLLTQTGEYFNRIGLMVIDTENGTIDTDFIECEEILDADGETVVGYKLDSELYTGTELITSAEVKAIKDGWISSVDAQLNEVIGSTELVLDNYDGGSRIVRLRETNTGDFAADALYYLFDNMGMQVDVAVMNGGGIRNKGVTGELTYKTFKDIHTFGNVACLQTVTGQQILDALEWGARGLGVGEEIGGFLHVSGLIYSIDTGVKSSVQSDDNGAWAGAPTGEYCVKDVMIYDRTAQSYLPIDLNASYNLAGYNYTLRDLGDGYAMFEGAVNVLDYVMEDYMVLANYVKGFENGVVGAKNSPLLSKYPAMLLDYGSVYGSGRITVKG